MLNWKDMEGPIPLLPTKSIPLYLGHLWNVVYAPINLHYNVSSRNFMASGGTQEVRTETQEIKNLQVYQESQTFMGSGYGLLL